MAFWYDGVLYDDTYAASDGDRLGISLLKGDIALKFGATVFTTMRVYNSDLDHPLTQWLAHCDRLNTSRLAFQWQQPDWTTVRAAAQRLTATYPVLRITLFPDGREWITGRSLPVSLSQHHQQGIAAWIAPFDYARSLPTHKTGNYLACWLAKQQAEKYNAQAAILTSPHGDWLETTTGNLWGWARGQWWTPMGDRCLPGLMRQYLQHLLARDGISINGSRWSPDIVAAFEAIAYSNCVAQLVPIHTVRLRAKNHTNEKAHTTLEYNPHHANLKALQARISAVANCDAEASR